MSSRADKALKNQKDKHHAILRELVQELPNKTCAECLAKGPRWASWSLGVFVCIRCAGIHRNLGVHISKMKSIDLDSWTPEQLNNMLKWGNKRAAEYFECYLPKDYVRPQANHALEAFIRNKYEKKLYIKKDGEPEPNPQSKLDRLKSDQKEEKVEKEKKSTNRQRRSEERKKKEPSSADASSPDKTILNMTQNPPVNAAQQKKNAPSNDLFSLDNQPTAQSNANKPASNSDLLNFGSWSEPVASGNNDQFQQANGNTSDPFASSGAATNPSDPFQANAGQQPVAQDAAPAKSTKESILSLYSSGGGTMMPPQQQQQQNQQMFGVQGNNMYMQHNVQGQGMYGQQQNMQQPNQMQMNQLNTQMQQMNFNQQQQQMQRQQMMHQQQMMSGQQMGAGFGQQSMGMYQQQQPQQQQQQPNMMHNMQQMNMQQQNNFNMMAQQRQQMQQQQQQQQGFMGNNWGNSQQGMMGMGQQQQRQQQQMMMQNGNMGMGGTSNGQTMNNLLWN